MTRDLHQPALDDLPEHIAETVRAIAALHHEHRRGASRIERAAAAATAWVGRPIFLALVLCLAAGWILINLALDANGAAPDPPPFVWLQGLASFTALLMTILILATGRREDQLTELRQQLILELAMMTEQRSAKVLQRLEALRRDLPSVDDAVDPAAEALAEPADPSLVADALRRTRDTPLED